MNGVKEKIISSSGSVTGTLSVLGSYQVCHNICMSLITILTFLGFTVAGMPLLFLTKVAVPFWIAAISLLIVAIILKYKKIMNISDKVILLNSGLIIVGTPFQQVQKFNYIFWIIGGVLAFSGIGWYFYDKFKKKRKN